jgi:hypothetical protein
MSCALFDGIGSPAHRMMRVPFLRWHMRQRRKVLQIVNQQIGRQLVPALQLATGETG